MSSNEDACQNRKEETVSITHETLKVKYSLKICAYLIYDYHFVVSFTFIQYIVYKHTSTWSVASLDTVMFTNKNKN